MSASKAEFVSKLVCKSCGSGPVIIVAQLFNEKREFLQKCWCGNCQERFSFTGKIEGVQNSVS